MPSALSRPQKNPCDYYRRGFVGFNCSISSSGNRTGRWGRAVNDGQGCRQLFPDRRATSRSRRSIFLSINGSFVNRMKVLNSLRTSRGALGSKCQLSISSTKNSLSIKFGLVVIIEVNPFPTLVLSLR